MQIGQSLSYNISVFFSYLGEFDSTVSQELNELLRLTEVNLFTNVQIFWASFWEHLPNQAKSSYFMRQAIHWWSDWPQSLLVKLLQSDGNPLMLSFTLQTITRV